MSVCADAGELVNLKRLTLSHNRLLSMPPSLCFLVNLEKLSLDNNAIESLPKRIGEWMRWPLCCFLRCTS